MCSSWDSVFRLSCRRFFPMVLWLCVFGTCASHDINLASWLSQYGYLPKESKEHSTMFTAEILHDAISEMQRFYNLECNGHMDEHTTTAMKQPRCGVSDNDDESKSNMRRKRYAPSGHKWDKNNLTYSIQNYIPTIGERETYETIRRAFNVWEKAIPLTFEEIPYEEIKNRRRDVADMMIFFESGSHGDGNAFDGPGGVLAHAYYPNDAVGPIAGDLHFDLAESWTIIDQNLRGSIHLFLVAVHELGHSLGLDHSSSFESIMFPAYNWKDTVNFQLSKDDIRGIQHIYELPCYNGDGRKYRGKVAKTFSGKTCQSWSAQTPHRHTRTPENNPHKGLDNNNYCRNPDGEKMPWCYTTDSASRWEYCPVLRCNVASGPEVTCYTCNGRNYRGEVARTTSGKTCQSWSAQTPHQHTRTPENHPRKGLESNYCRNPDNERRPWCYTTDSQKRWEYCQVPKCEVSPGPELTCYTGDGSKYRGKVAWTVSGKTCQKWSAQTPHNHDRTPEKHPLTGLVDNYCRNPDGETMPWCYTTDSETRWEYCPVSTCEVAPGPALPCYTGDGRNYRGTVASTTSGKTCQSWSAQTPHKHVNTPNNYPCKDLDNNYCRNPDNEEMPWCYTTESETRWEYCPVPSCDVAPDNIVLELACYTGDGVDYRGKVTRTISGKTCQSWSAQTPHNHDFAPENQSNKGLDNNYCRNPDSETMPWCYTTDSQTRWEYCQVPLCDVAPGPELISH